MGPSAFSRRASDSRCRTGTSILARRVPLADLRRSKSDRGAPSRSPVDRAAHPISGLCATPRGASAARGNIATSLVELVAMLPRAEGTYTFRYPSLRRPRLFPHLYPPALFDTPHELFRTADTKRNGLASIPTLVYHAALTPLLHYGYREHRTFCRLNLSSSEVALPV